MKNLQSEGGQGIGSSTGQVRTATVSGETQSAGTPREIPPDPTPWGMESVRNFVSAFTSWFHVHGYLLCVYGSALRRDCARDLDLMLVPWRPNPVPPNIVFCEFCEIFRKTPDEQPAYRGLMKTWSRTCHDAYGRVIDMQFRYSDVTLEESFAYSMEHAE